MAQDVLPEICDECGGAGIDTDDTVCRACGGYGSVAAADDGPDEPVEDDDDE